jgi:hypothetical protein
MLMRSASAQLALVSASLTKACLLIVCGVHRKRQRQRLNTA